LYIPPSSSFYPLVPAPQFVIIVNEVPAVWPVTPSHIADATLRRRRVCLCLFADRRLHARSPAPHAVL